MLGFKFVTPQDYPKSPPFAFLDEKEDAEVVEMVDYLDKGNRIMFQYLADWSREPNITTPASLKKFNITELLTKVYQLFCQLPPVSLSELFGAVDDQPQMLKKLSSFKDEVMQEQNELDDFDPMAEL